MSKKIDWPKVWKTMMEKGYAVKLYSSFLSDVEKIVESQLEDKP